MAENRTTSSYLTPRPIDDDASSSRSFSLSVSDQDSDSEDDEILGEVKDSTELARYDRTVLDEADEINELLVKNDAPADPLRRIFSRSDNGSHVRVGKLRRKSKTRGRSKSRDTRNGKGRSTSNLGEEGRDSDERAILLHDLNRGRRDSDVTSVSSVSTDTEFERLVTTSDPKRRSWRVASLYASGVLVLFCILFLGAYKQSSKFRSSPSSSSPSQLDNATLHGQPLQQRTLLSNGTSIFRPTTIYISLDGFRADFLQLGITPALSALVSQGISPPYMLPSFPSVTFPNHYTLMTGLYPEAHGIVGNTFYDPHLKDDFYYTDPSKNTEAKWWTAEPLWSTAEEQGVRSAVHMWPGSEAGIGKVPPTIVDGFNKSQVLGKKTERILQLLDLPGDDDDIVRGAGSEKGRRPNFIAAYVPNVDANGHKYGPNSTIVHDTIAKVDAMLGELFKGLEERNLTNVVNVVVVSDHGMATTSTSRLVQLEDLVDLSLVERIDGWPHRGLRPKKPVEENLKTLEKQLAAAYPKYKDRIEVYNKSTMPERYHFTRNDRIAPLWVFPKAGWAVVERPEFDAKEMVQTGKDYYPKGIHGYDNEHPLMRAIFIARGPKFSEKTNMASKGNTGGRRMAVFQNIEVYNIIAESLEVVPEPNNGTMKLPLKSVGWHEVPKPHESAQIFLPKNSTLETLPSTHASTSSTTTSMSAPKVKPPPATSSIQSTSTTQNTATPSAEPSVAPVDDDKSSPKDDQGFFAKVWNGFIEDVDAAKQWAGHVLHLDGEHEKDEGP